MGIGNRKMNKLSQGAQDYLRDFNKKPFRFDELQIERAKAKMRYEKGEPKPWIGYTVILNGGAFPGGRKNP